MGETSSKLSDEEKLEVLNGNPCMEEIAVRIRSGRIKRVVVAVGAGVSVSAGIPDFRSPGTGLYHQVVEKYKVPRPEDIFCIKYYQQNPKPFNKLARELFPGRYKPTKGHFFVKLLHQKGLLLRVYTQNIDNLERVASLPEEKIVEAHGSFSRVHCIQCHQSYPLRWFKDQLYSNEHGDVERCSRNLLVDAETPWPPPGAVPSPVPTCSPSSSSENVLDELNCPSPHDLPSGSLSSSESDAPLSRAEVIRQRGDAETQTGDSMKQVQQKTAFNLKMDAIIAADPTANTFTAEEMWGNCCGSSQTSDSTFREKEHGESDAGGDDSDAQRSRILEQNPIDDAPEEVSANISACVPGIPVILPEDALPGLDGPDALIADMWAGCHDEEQDEAGNDIRSSNGKQTDVAELELDSAKKVRAIDPMEGFKVVRCDGLIKPAIVFFGESLPERYHELVETDLPQADLLVIMGTSLQVLPFALIITKCSESCPRLLINRDRVGEQPFFGNARFCYDSQENYRDVFWQGDCDDGVVLLCKMLGWEKDLEEIEEEFERRYIKEGSEIFLQNIECAKI